MATKQDLETQKLELEIAALKRPNSRNPTFWISVVTALVAVAGVFAQSYISKYEVAKADFTVAKAQAEAASAAELRDHASQELKAIQDKEQAAQQRVTELDAQRLKLEGSLSRLVSAVKTSTATATPAVQIAASEATAASNGYYEVNVYSFGPGSQQVMDRFVTWLNGAGYSVGKAQALSERPDWLSRKTAVLYYDDSALERAQRLAAQLKATGASDDVAVVRGSGKGIATGHESTSFRVHIIG